MSTDLTRAGWLLGGNDDVDSTDFLGTTDAKDFPIKTNNVLRGTFKSGGVLELVTPLKIIGQADEVQSITQAHSPQTANLDEWKNSAGSNLIEIDGSGRMGIGRDPVVKFDLQGTQDEVTFRTTGFPGQTNDIFRVILGVGGQSLKVNSRGLLRILDGSTIDYGTDPLSIVRIKPNFDINVNNTDTFGMELGGNWTYSLGPTGTSRVTALDILLNLKSTVSGTGNDAFVITAARVAAQFEGINRTITEPVVAGMFEVIITNDGTINDAVGLTGQVRTIAGGTIVNGISGKFLEPRIFFGGTITTGITGQFIGGSQAGTNWNCQWINDVPSFMEGSLSIGHTAVPGATLDVAGTSDQIQLLIKGHSTQTANLFEFKDNSSVVQLSLSNTGNLLIKGDLNHDGSKVGFYTATPLAKPTITGSRAGNAALADFLTKLATLGLLTDSTIV